ncbi:DUF4360 domain-containing protein [Nocardia sp. CDC159]|uniref:DUF4360 domain-containing protein n=1 Tax=Nocardia pulmonis TaxID=2951408 RepID=A0A9X2E191_9NOCA|nr:MULTISPECIES: DUF4360 domain-containing protein [Nocardia]MCM6771994.1 DUF4360 domain-containing protein [Nocardia pulmonis]MCM6785348.1 DUF4360 domain-containing protein [Nocardia sp. CDC159]
MYKKLAAFGAALFAFALPLSASPATGVPAVDRTDSPPPGKITIDVVTVNGSGCPQGTARVWVSEDNTSFRVAYDRFTARAGGDAAPTDFRKFCQIVLQVHVPQGFTYGIASATYRGFAHLEPGASALELARYYFQGDSATEFVDHGFNGPMHDDWQVTDTTDIAEIVYQPCGRTRDFNINTQLRVKTGGSNAEAGTSYITMDSTNGSVNTTYRFAWKRC